MSALGERARERAEHTEEQAEEQEGARMPQGTVKHFDEQERTGSLVMEDHTEVGIDATSVEGSGLRTLRIGQRVRFDLVEESGHKVARTLQIVTLG